MADEITKLKDQIDPEVLAPILNYTLKNALRFTPLAQVDTTLQGQPGSTIKFPAYTYIGDAADVAEGEPIPKDKLGTTSKSIQVKKAAKAVQLTDEVALSGYGDPVGETNNQLALALANKIDNDLLDAAKGGTQKATITPDVAGIMAAEDVFNDENDATTVAIVSPKTASLIRADAIKQNAGSEVGATQLVNGTYYDVLGVQIVRSRKLKDTEAIFIKSNAIVGTDGTMSPSQESPALKLVMKRNVFVETERHANTKSTEFDADAHYAAYLYDDTKVVVGTISPK